MKTSDLFHIDINAQFVRGMSWRKKMSLHSLLQTFFYGIRTTQTHNYHQKVENANFLQKFYGFLVFGGIIGYMIPKTH